MEMDEELLGINAKIFVRVLRDFGITKPEQVRGLQFSHLQEAGLLESFQEFGLQLPELEELLGNEKILELVEEEMAQLTEIEDEEDDKDEDEDEEASEEEKKATEVVANSISDFFFFRGGCSGSAKKRRSLIICNFLTANMDFAICWENRNSIL